MLHILPVKKAKQWSARNVPWNVRNDVTIHNKESFHGAYESNENDDNVNDNNSVSTIDSDLKYHHVDMQPECKVSSKTNMTQIFLLFFSHVFIFILTLFLPHCWAITNRPMIAWNTYFVTDSPYSMIHNVILYRSDKVPMIYSTTTTTGRNPITTTKLIADPNYLQPLVYLKLYQTVVVYYSMIFFIAAVGLISTYNARIRRVLHYRINMSFIPKIVSLWPLGATIGKCARYYSSPVYSCFFLFFPVFSLLFLCFFPMFFPLFFSVLFLFIFFSSFSSSPPSSPILFSPICSRISRQVNFPTYFVPTQNFPKTSRFLTKPTIIVFTGELMLTAALIALHSYWLWYWAVGWEYRPRTVRRAARQSEIEM